MAEQNGGWEAGFVLIFLKFPNFWAEQVLFVIQFSFLNAVLDLITLEFKLLKDSHRINANLRLFTWPIVSSW